MWATGMCAERGVTLLELLVVLAVLGMVSGLAATAYGGGAARQQQRQLVAITGYLQSARAAAVESGAALQVAVDAGRFAGPGCQRVMCPKLPSAGPAVQLRWVGLANSRAGSGPTFFADGSATPGSLEVDWAESRSTIWLDWTGSVRLDAGARLER